MTHAEFTELIVTRYDELLHVAMAARARDPEDCVHDVTLWLLASPKPNGRPWLSRTPPATPPRYTRLRSEDAWKYLVTILRKHARRTPATVREVPVGTLETWAQGEWEQVSV